MWFYLLMKMFEKFNLGFYLCVKWILIGIKNLYIVYMYIMFIKYVYIYLLFNFFFIYKRYFN